jgi:hypothetical protein
VTVVTHVVLCLIILILSGMSSAHYCNTAQALSLGGSAVLAYFPWALLGIYALVVVFTRNAFKRSTRVGGIVVAFVLAVVCNYYPNWLVERDSQKIEIRRFVKHGEMFLPRAEIESFERAFKTPTVQESVSGGGPWLLVPRKNFSQAMITFLQDQALK